MSGSLDIAFTAWGGLGAGLLTGKYHHDPTGGGGRIHAAGWGALEQHEMAIARDVAAVAKDAGAPSFMGEIHDQIDDHRHTIV